MSGVDENEVDWDDWELEAQLQSDLAATRGDSSDQEDGQSEDEGDLTLEQLDISADEHWQAYIATVESAVAGFNDTANAAQDAAREMTTTLPTLQVARPDRGELTDNSGYEVGELEQDVHDWHVARKRELQELFAPVVACTTTPIEPQNSSEQPAMSPILASPTQIDDATAINKSTQPVNPPRSSAASPVRESSHRNEVTDSSWTQQRLRQHEAEMKLMVQMGVSAHGPRVLIVL